MEVRLITQECLETFRSLLLPDTAEALAKGLPMLALGLVEDATACGAAAVWLQDDTLEVRSLYVAPDFRRRGGGRALVDTLCRLAGSDCQELSLSYTATQPEHDTLSPFLTALGFSPKTSAQNLYRLTVEELGTAAFFTEKDGGTGAISFERVPTVALRYAYRAAAAQTENYLEAPLTDPQVDARVSGAILEKGAVRSFAAVTVSAPGHLSLAWVKSGRPQDVPVLLRFCFARIRELYPPETTLTIHAVTPASARLVAAILPQARPISHHYIRPISRN